MSARLSVQSSELGPPPPHPQASVALPHSLAGSGVGGPDSAEGTDTLVLS
jgi:hypothetical protein